MFCFENIKLKENLKKGILILFLIYTIIYIAEYIHANKVLHFFGLLLSINFFLIFLPSQFIRYMFYNKIYYRIFSYFMDYSNCKRF